MNVLTHFVLWRLHLAAASTMYTAAECACLERHAAGKKRLVEIGCWHGVNTRRLRRVMAPDGVVFGVDPYAPGRLGFSATQIIAHREVDKEANFRATWEAWSPLVGTGARYVLGNSRSCEAMPIEGAGSVAFTREVIAHDPRFRLVETVDTFTVLARL